MKTIEKLIAIFKMACHMAKHKHFMCIVVNEQIDKAKYAYFNLSDTGLFLLAAHRMMKVEKEKSDAVLNEALQLIKN
jgi:hypothetical protein